MTEALLAEGLVKIKEGGRSIPQLRPLVEIEDNAKAQGKGVWSENAHVNIILTFSYT